MVFTELYNHTIKLAYDINLSIVFYLKDMYETIWS